MSKLLHKAVRQKSQSAFSVYQQHLANRPVNVSPEDPSFMPLLHILLPKDYMRSLLFIAGSSWPSWVQKWSCSNSCREGGTCFIYCAAVLHWWDVSWSYFKRNSWSNCNCNEQIRWKIKFRGRWWGNMILIPIKTVDIYAFILNKRLLFFGRFFVMYITFYLHFHYDLIFPYIALRILFAGNHLQMLLMVTLQLFHILKVFRMGILLPVLSSRSLLWNFFENTLTMLTQMTYSKMLIVVNGGKFFG